ncbi:MAG: Ni/Fe-hydrogenase, b-type cytochrome subunit [Lutibacter sp.]|uniref:Ni/Fe-hydrogenase, b-type cytochrome subunit n=1 Tax=Lutibacter sp. TaxID=1925666 RepID=UPI00385EA004
MATTFNFKRVYVWELPVRLFHWVTAFSTIILIITGFIIANPPAINAHVEATNSFWFGYVRAIHFITAYILIANLIFRIYWAFTGNQFSNWRNFIPYTKKGIKNIFHVLKVDIFLMEDKGHKLYNISIGHNYLAAFSYFIMTLFFIFQVMTGLALIADTSSWWLPEMFKGVSNMLGGDIVTRYIHHIFTWLFMVFIIIHVYLVLFHDYVEARGEASSMISGFKFIRSERVKESEAEIIKKAEKQMWEGDKKKAKNKEK